MKNTIFINFFLLISSKLSAQFLDIPECKSIFQSETKEWGIGQQTLDLEVSQYPSGVYQLHWQSNLGRIVVSWMKGD